jgi:hypothetical protein
MEGRTTMTINAIGKPLGCKLLRITAGYTEPAIAGSGVDAIKFDSISIHGDFFAVPEEAFEELEKELSGSTIETIALSFERLAKDKGIQLVGITGKGVEETLRRAIDGTSMQTS